MLYCILVGAGDAIEKIIHDKKFFHRIAGDDNNTAYYIGSFPISRGSQKVHKIITPTRAHIIIISY